MWVKKNIVKFEKKKKEEKEFILFLFAQRLHFHNFEVMKQKKENVFV